MRFRIGLLLIATLVTDARRPAPQSLRGRMARVWPAEQAWTDEHERAYGEFVARLGDALEARRCARLDECLADPEANLLHDARVDAGLRLTVDCADLPYALRAYFAFKHHLPFGFVAATRSSGGWDPRLALGVEPAAWRTWRDFASPAALLREMTDLVHSGMYRIAADHEASDFYPVRIDREAVVPGAIFYDPAGHVSVVGRVRPDGVVYFLSGSPDGALTWKRFGSAYSVGSIELGGGFKRFRPLALAGRRLVRTGNAALPDFDPRSQYAVDGAFHRWVRQALTDPAVGYDPIADLREQVRALCRDVGDRVEAVDLAVQAGLAARPHPDELPDNIFVAGGDWEVYATPARDARLKTAFRDLAESLYGLDDLRERAAELRAAWDQEIADPACRFAYRASNGAVVPFTMDTVIDRLFELSFDPYHCPELRWGAPAESDELASCPDDGYKLTWYLIERRLRYRMERSMGPPTPLDSGPDERPEVDVRRLLGPPAA